MKLLNYNLFTRFKVFFKKKIKNKGIISVHYRRDLDALGENI